MFDVMKETLPLVDHVKPTGPSGPSHAFQCGCCGKEITVGRWRCLTDSNLPIRCVECAEDSVKAQTPMGVCESGGDLQIYTPFGAHYAGIISRVDIAA